MNKIIIVWMISACFVINEYGAEVDTRDTSIDTEKRIRKRISLREAVMQSKIKAKKHKKKNVIYLQYPDFQDHDVRYRISLKRARKRMKKFFFYREASTSRGWREHPLWDAFQTASTKMKIFYLERAQDVEVFYTLHLLRWDTFTSFDKTRIGKECTGFTGISKKKLHHAIHQILDSDRMNTFLQNNPSTSRDAMKQEIELYLRNMHSIACYRTTWSNVFFNADTADEINNVQKEMIDSDLLKSIEAERIEIIQKLNKQWKEEQHNIVYW